MYLYKIFCNLTQNVNIQLKNINKLLKNKKKMFNLTFPTSESLNKYRDDDN